jgi:Glyoxalase-like domain
MATQLRAAAVLYARNMRSIAAFYEAVAGMQRRAAGEDHIILESPAFQLVVHAIPPHIVESIRIETPVRPRERTPIKLAFFVDDLAAARSAAARLNGSLKAPDAEWQFEGTTVCDGHDPEGNVFQLRQPQVR